MGHDYSRGMHWIGHPGALVPFIDYGSEGVSDEHAPVIQEGMGGGRRVRVPRGRAPRSWKMTIPAAHADDVAHLRTLMAATLPPYQLVTAEAQVSNVLTPERSTLQSLISPSGLALGGWFPIASEYQGGGAMARLNPSAAFGNLAGVWVGPCPIPPIWTGRKVTASAYLATARAAGARVSLQWLAATGATMTQINGTYVTGMDGLRRSTVTATPPAGAAACRLYIQYAEILAQPQVTWTDAPIPEWSLGNGADQVVPTESSRDTDLAVPDNYGLRRGDYQLAFTEVVP